VKRETFAIIGSFLVALLLSQCSVSVPAAQPTGTATHAPVASHPTIVSLTFDDGDADNFPVAALLTEHGLHGTFYIPSGLVGSAGYMTWEQLNTLQADGHEIGGHTLNHQKLEGLDSETLRYQICDDRQNLIDHGFTPVSFAYPFGNYDVHVKQMAQDCGYADARTILGGAETTPAADPYALRALPYIVSDTKFDKLRRYVSNSFKGGDEWIILIFHHVCDSCDFFSVKPEVMNQFVPWLVQQQGLGHIQVMTVGEVISRYSKK
jgi:peptidoglycan/xylan/chitin deacetylase (PgdA/CDA1 family)